MEAILCEEHHNTRQGLFRVYHFLGCSERPEVRISYFSEGGSVKGGSVVIHDRNSEFSHEK